MMDSSPDFVTLLDQLRLVHAMEIGSLQHQLNLLQRQIQDGFPSSRNVLHNPTNSDAATGMPEEQSCEHQSESSEQEGHAIMMRDNDCTSDSPKTKYSSGKCLAEISRGICAPDGPSKKSGLAGKLSMAHVRAPTWSSQATNLREQVRVKVARMLIRPWFERFFLALLALDVFLIAIDMQNKGLVVGTDLQFYASLGHDHMWTEAVLRTARLICSFLFFVEVAAKIIARTITSDWVNLVDSVLVVLELLNAFVLEFDTVAPLLLLRMCRLLRFGRLYRILNGLPGIDTLYLMTTILSGCKGILLWSSIALVSIQLAMAISINLLLFATYFKTSSDPPEVQREVFEYFGTFTRAMFSVFEITLANWPPACRLLAEHVSEWFMLICVIYKLTIGFAVVSVINGVFMKETFKIADTDDFIMMKQSEKSAKVHALKMKMLFDETDLNGDGEIDMEEFREVVGNPAISAWLTSQGICCDDVEKLFQVLDSQSREDGRISFDELMHGISRLKGNAKSMDLVSLMHDYERAPGDLALERKQVAELVARHRANTSNRSASVDRKPAQEDEGAVVVEQLVRGITVGTHVDICNEGLPDELYIRGWHVAALKRTP